MSEPTSRVTVNSKLTVVSSRPHGSVKIHPLSALDHAMASHTVHAVFYYGESPFGSFEMDPMRESLSEVLTLYPTVTGRLSLGEEGNWVVKCNDAGVRVTMTKVGATLDEWLRSADWREERDLAVIDHMPEDPYIWSQFRVQINDFEGGGVAIGVSFTHLNADLTSATLLLKAWVDNHRAAAIPPPPFTRPPIAAATELPNPAAKSSNFYHDNSKSSVRPIKMASVTFKFSHSTINQSLSELKPNFPAATPFDFLAALFWMRVRRIKNRKNEQRTSLSICTDIRQLFRSPNSHRFFGNALHFSQLSIDPDEMDHYGVADVAGLVHGHLERLAGDEDGEIWSAMEWLESQKEKGGRYAAPLKVYGRELTCVCMEHMVGGSESVMYATAFMGDEKPVHVSCDVGNADGEGLMVVMPSCDGEMARNVTVMLPEMEVAALCEDEAILGLRPTMLLCGPQ